MIPILYACVARGTTVLAEFSPVPSPGDNEDDDLPPRLATRCLAAELHFHRHYSHTSGGRIHAFLVDDPLIFFVIADEAVLAKPQALLFLRRLRDAFSSSAVRRRRADGPSDALSRLCLQEDFLPEIRRIAQSISSQDEEPPPPRPCPPPPTASPQPSEPDVDQIERKKNSGKGKNKMVISVVDRDITESDAGNRGSKSLRKLWRQHVRTIILIDLLVCCLLLAVWLSICRGFVCITH